MSSVSFDSKEMIKFYDDQTKGADTKIKAKINVISEELQSCGGKYKKNYY